MAHDGEMITLVGEIDMARSVDAVVDMSAVSFCGSEGIEFLDGLLECARSKLGTVTVINASDAVQRLIKVCGLDGAIRHEHQ